MSDPIAIVPPRVPFLDPRTGDISKQWYLLILAIVRRVGGVDGAGTDELAIGPMVGNSAPNLAALLQELVNATGSSPAQAVPRAMDDTLNLDPAVAFGTLGEQNADRVSIAGGNIRNVVVGVDAGTLAAPSLYFGADAGTGLYRIGVDNFGVTIAGVKLVDYASTLVKFTGTVAVSGQLALTIAVGAPPLIVTSTTFVPNLYVARAALSDTATALTAPTTFPAAATDLPTVITLANALRAAAISKGL